MRIKLLTLAFAPSLGGFDDRPLETFVADKEVLAVREHFFVVHDQPYLACLVSWQEVPAAPPGRDAGAAAEAPVPTRSRRGSRSQVVEDLDPADRALFETLRAWRAERARRDGKPPYVLFTNRELAAIARTRPTSRNALLHIEGVGPGKVERYGAEILARVPSAGPTNRDPELNHRPVAAPADPTGSQEAARTDDRDSAPPHGQGARSHAHAPAQEPS